MIDLPAKQIRARVIYEHLRALDRHRDPVVCFTCGNAARALRDIGLTVLEVGEHGGVTPNRWFTPAEIALWWPHAFDATSGHLRVDMMELVGHELRQYMLRNQIGVEQVLRVPTGSGETAVALSLAFPRNIFTAVYDDGNPATAYNELAPLNRLVCRLCHIERLPKQESPDV